LHVSTAIYIWKSGTETDVVVRVRALVVRVAIPEPSVRRVVPVATGVAVIMLQPLPLGG
jgi:hypothetical protein